MKTRALAWGAVLFCLAILPAGAADSMPDVYIYTFEGKGNMTRNGKVAELKIDMPIRNGDSFKIEPESWIDYVFFNSVGLRVTGPGEVWAKKVKSLSGLEMRVSAGEVLVHTDDSSGDTFDFSVETPHAVIHVEEPVLMIINIEPADKDGKSGKTFVAMKKGRADVLIKRSDSTIRILENQKLDISPAAYVPAAQGAMPEELRPADRARTVYVPSKETEEEE